MMYIILKVMFFNKEIFEFEIKVFFTFLLVFGILTKNTKRDCLIFCWMLH